MGLVGVGISLPNSPGLVGQFQWFTLLGLSLYLPAATDKTTDIHAQALAYAITQHLLQVGWYVAMGALGIASPWVSFADLRASRKRPPTATEAAAAAGASTTCRPPRRRRDRGRQETGPVGSRRRFGR